MTPQNNSDATFWIGFISTIVLAIKGLVVLVIELLKLVPKLKDAVVKAYRALKGHHAKRKARHRKDHHPL